jgi:ribosomal protein L40E
MFAASDPNLLIGGFAVAGLTIAGLWRLIAWVRDAPVTPNPWDAEVEQKLAEPETVEVCRRCLTKQPPDAWFCAHCGSAVGPYNNLMPYVSVFSEGEVFRSGASGRLRASPLIVCGYLILSLTTLGFFAPIYWIYFLKNQQRMKAEKLGATTASGETPP